MRQFAGKSFLFFITVVILFYLRPVYLLIGEKYQQKNSGSETYNALMKSKKRHKQRKLVIGDSVGNQLFPNKEEKDSINSLATTEAIGMVGHYLLLKNYLEAGNDVDDVYLIYTPFSFRNNLDEIFTFHYFLKPFFVSEYKPSFSDVVQAQIHKIPKWYLCREPYILTSNWAPKYQPADPVGYAFLSPISADYLQRIKHLSEEYHFKLTVLPTPTSILRKAEIDKFNHNEIADAGLTNEFRTYFQNINYLDRGLFSDGVHLKKPLEYATAYREKWMK